MARELTDKQRRFVEEYCVDFNATQAAIRAGYSSRAAQRIGSENRSKPLIQDAIEARMAELRDQAGVSKEMVLREYARIGFADIRNTVVWRANVTGMGEDPDTGEERLRCFNEVQLRDSADLSPDTAAAIKSVSLAANGTLKIEMHDKKGALDSLAKEMGLFIEKKQLVGANGQPIDPPEVNEHELARRVVFFLRLAQSRGEERASLNGHGGDGASVVDTQPRAAD